MSDTFHYAIDGHIHIYPHYNLNHAIRTGVHNLRNSCSVSDSDSIIPIWLLVERYDCNFFSEAADGAPIDFDKSDLILKKTKEPETLVVEENGNPLLYILAGRQVVTTENLEILSLASIHFIKDRTLSATDAVQSINEQGGIAAVNWAPGKWFFSRGKVVNNLLETFSPTELCVGDTSLRPMLWSTPTLMTKATKLGFKTIAGSDPLPFENEEDQIGLYSFHISGPFDRNQPAKSLKDLLKSPDVPTELAGQRNSLATFGRRQFKIMTDKR